MAAVVVVKHSGYTKLVLVVIDRFLRPEVIRVLGTVLVKVYVPFLSLSNEVTQGVLRLGPSV